jgi:hypothetical protein
LETDGSREILDTISGLWDFINIVGVLVGLPVLGGFVVVLVLFSLLFIICLSLYGCVFKVWLYGQ